ncbi:Bax inhibitor-1/YccA family protein [Bailinhaonella thermotolerans]|uniref:Bax inhibitor-1/YccA family protein n=1 Tax=Bailinhaonella thermotolerans TaxID=1070861 RepID=A0A3A4AUP1_9ACTN|nr:Bax inhibitor-1/YccA family protein [Bailinhaonella thermotolerans]RJL33305.1 Bax inhibitor-1/YccA family protein [Bailinhaonella thermotolerans]
MESRNPVFNRRGAFARNQGGWQQSPPPSAQQLNEMYNQPAYAPPAVGRPVTLDDVVVRSAMTLVTLVATAAAAWYFNLSMGVAVGALLVGLVLWAIVTFGNKANPFLVLGFAAAYGVMVGVVSHRYDDLFHGIVFQAVVGTALAFAGTLVVYALRIVRVTPKFTRFVIAAGFALMGLMLVNLLASFFIEDGIGIRSGGPLAYVFSVVAILVGCFFLLLDFASIEEGVREGAPQKFAWMAAFGLTLSLVWIYLEILRLLSYFSSSD